MKPLLSRTKSPLSKIFKLRTVVGELLIIYWVTLWEKLTKRKGQRVKGMKNGRGNYGGLRKSKGY